VAPDCAPFAAIALIAIEGEFAVEVECSISLNFFLLKLIRAKNRL
jgi:hypothetical protein